MTTVTISPEFQVGIPQEICNAVGLRKGEKAQVFAYRNRIEIIPVRELRKMRGFLKGMNTTIEREDDRV